MKRGPIDDKMKARGYLTIAEVAEKTGLTEQTLRAHVKDGRLGVMKIGVRIFTTMASVVAYLGAPQARALGLPVPPADKPAA